MPRSANLSNTAAIPCGSYHPNLPTYLPAGNGKGHRILLTYNLFPLTSAVLKSIITITTQPTDRSSNIMDTWNSRRSTVLSTKGMCCTSQPLATAAGVKILEKGGTAADAAVAMAACLNVLEPCSTGIGGDAFSLYYDASSTGDKVSCMQGNGAAPAGFTLDYLRSRGIAVDLAPLDAHSPLTVTVPGAAMLWEDMIRKHGKLTLAEVLQPAIDLAEHGFVISEITAHHWARGHFQGDEALKVFRPNGQFPKVGDVVFNKDLAGTFRRLATHGAKEGFYSGITADAIVECMQEMNGVLNHADLAAHVTREEAPISCTYRGHTVYETPPPTHGVAALLALNILDAIPCDKARGSAEQAHIAIEAMRCGFADTLQYCCDSAFTDKPVEKLLSPEYTKSRVPLIDPSRASSIPAGDISPFVNSDTVYFCVIDAYGNGCSFIISNYMAFGTGIVPKNCGFTLQNRGYNFSLDPSHPNCVAPGKRPYHTIIPSLITKPDGSLYATLGVMGGFMQPQGHVQVIRNLLDFNMTPQAAMDAPRWCLTGIGATQSAADVNNYVVNLEDGYGCVEDGGHGDMAAPLRSLGHTVKVVRGTERSVFGRGQVIVRGDNGVLWGGSDPRADGCAMLQL